MRNEQGFTLIELVMVIVILGVLAAVAVPKFVDLSGDAKASAVKGVAGGLSSASAINYAAKVSNKTSVDTSGGCTDAVAGSLLAGTSFGGADDDYSISGTSPWPTTPAPQLGDTLDCTVTNAADGNYTATFALIYAN